LLRLRRDWYPAVPESIPFDMNPNLKWKVLFILLVILGCIYGLIGLPTFPTSVADLRNNFSQQIKLGLDLQGGTHLILQVQTQEAIAHYADAREEYSL
jgi:preprotein translocase subunit SecD